MHLAARENEAAVDAALRRLIDQEAVFSSEAVEALLDLEPAEAMPTVEVASVDLNHYDGLLLGVRAPSGDGAWWEVQP